MVRSIDYLLGHIITINQTIMAQMAREHHQPFILNESIKESRNQSLFLSLGQVSTENSERSDYQKDGTTQKGRCRLTACQVSSAVCLLISLFTIFGLPVLVEHLIIQQSIEQTILKPSNQGMWAHFPGQTETIILRNFTFFKLDNQPEFLFHRQKPTFREISGFKVQELEDFLDIEYLEDGNLVRVRDWLRFAEWAESKDLDEKVSILNMGNIGYWSTIKTARPTLLLQQGLALLFTNLEESVIPMLIGSGISQQFLPNASITFSSLLSPAGISKSNLQFMWSDPAYGLSDSQNLGFWAEAAINSYQNDYNTFLFSQQAKVLKNYFVLSDSQLKSLMQKIYSYVTVLRKLLLENHYCVEVEIEDCTGRYLAVAQLADGWVTGNTPPVSTISANDSICDNNSTCYGKYPQPYAFAKNKFTIDEELARRVNYSSNDVVTFPREAVLSWFNYNHSIQSGLNYNTARNCLLHIGNLDDLWQLGTNFQQSHNISHLQEMMSRFGLRSHTEALVFWRWIVYFTNEFVLQNQGNSPLGLANIFTSGLYEQFTLLQDHLQPFLLAEMLKQELKGMGCRQFFQNALGEHDNPQLIDAICRGYDYGSEDFTGKMVDICENKYGKEWNTLYQKGVSLFSMQNFCDLHSQNSVGSFLHNYKLALDKLYGCRQTSNPYCSNYQLALLQWQDSRVTLNPPLPSLPANTTFSAWHKPSKPIEYQHFISAYFPKQQDSFPRFNLSQLYFLFTFQQLFSTNMLVKSLDQQAIDPFFFQYIRYVGIYITLNGFTTTRTVREFLFGYQDDFLAGIKNAYPPFGGDPSAPSVISFNDLNYTKEQATQTIVFKTGKDDFRNVYQNYEINGYKYLVNNYTWFNGNQSVWAWKSPWAEEDYFHGTTAKVFAPDQFQADNISMLIPQVQRYGGNYFHNETKKVQRYGAEIYMAHLTSAIGEVNKENAKYYQTIPNVFNVSSIYGMPLYVTKNHFLNATEWLQKVDIYNEDKSIHYTEVSQYDDSFVMVEPYTGASFQSCVYLQNNYLHQRDLLYDYPNDTMLPVFSVWRSGNLTEEKYKEIYAPLITALAVKASLKFVGIGLALIAVVGLVWSTYKKCKIATSSQPSSPLFGPNQPQGQYHFTNLEEEPKLQPIIHSHQIQQQQ